MFKKRRGKGPSGTSRVKIEKKKKFSFNRWLKGVFKKKSKTKTKSKQNQTQGTDIVQETKKASITTLFKNKVKISKLNVKDIELIEGINSNDLKKRFSVYGSKAKILEGMVADYKKGRLSLPGLSHKSKFDAKSLDKARLNKMIKEYDEGKRKKDLEEARKNANELKKKFSLTGSQGNRLDKVIEDLNKNKGSKMHLVKTLLDPKKLTKERVQKLIRQYEEAQKKNRGISYMMTQSKLSFLVSKRKIQNLMEDMKDIGLSGILKKGF